MKGFKRFLQKKKKNPGKDNTNTDTSKRGKVGTSECEHFFIHIIRWYDILQW